MRAFTKYIQNSFNDSRLQSRLEDDLSSLISVFMPNSSEYEQEKFAITYAEPLRITYSKLNKSLADAVKYRQHEIEAIIESNSNFIDAEFSRQKRNYTTFLSAVATGGGIV